MGVPSELVERRLWSELEERPDVFAAQLIDLPPADVVDVLNRLRLADAAAVLNALPVSRAIEVFDQPTLRRRGALLEQLAVERGAEILTGLSADERTDVAREMGEHGCRRLLPKLPADARAEVERLLRYPDHSAGGIMTTEFVRLDPGMTVGQVLKHIRAVAGEKETIYACYVLEPGPGRLVGAVSLRDLVMAELQQPVVEVMRRHPITVEALEDRESVAQKIAKYNLLAVPVLERDGSVVGFVTVDDVIDVLRGGHPTTRLELKCEPRFPRLRRASTAPRFATQTSIRVAHAGRTACPALDIHRRALDRGRRQRDVLGPGGAGGGARGHAPLSEPRVDIGVGAASGRTRTRPWEG